MPEYNEENTRGGKAGVAARKAVGSDAYRGISKALVGSAYRSFGKAFQGGGYTPRGHAPDESYLDNWEESGRRAQEMLETRWWENDFKTFRKNHLDKYQEQIQALGDKAGYLTDELKEGRWWATEEGPPELLDFNDEAQRAKINRLRGQVEKEAMNKVMELQIGLNNAAAEKYASNPIVDKMIQGMMEGQMKMLAGQFRQPGTAQAVKEEQQIRGGEADIGYKKALTRQADAQAKGLLEQGGKYKSTDNVMRDKSPAEAARFFTNHVEGKALLAGTEFPRHLQRLEQQTADGYVQRQKWTPQEAGMEVNQNATNAFVQAEQPRIQQRAMYEWMKGEYGVDAADEAAADRPGMLEDILPPFKYDVKTMPNKKEVKKKTEAWDALGVEKANEQMRRDPTLTKEEAKSWLLDEWFPEAMDGRDIAEGGAYLEQLDGLTADQLNKAAAPYISAVRKSLEKASKWIGTGPETEQLLPAQQPSRDRRPRRGGLGRAVSGLFDEEAYAPDFKKQFPQKDEPKEE